MMILILGILSEEQQALVEKIFRENHVQFQRISFKIVKSEEEAKDVVSTAYIKIMDNIWMAAILPSMELWILTN